MTDEKDMEQVPNQPEAEQTPASETPANDQAPPEEASADGSAESQGDASAVNEEAASSVEDAVGVVNEDDVPQEDAEAAMLAMLEDLPDEKPGTSAEEINFGSAKVSSAEFQHLSESGEQSEPRNIDLLMDVNLPVSIELGKTRMSISDILSLGPGSVVELSKLAGEPVDVLVNNNAIARGEVVVIDENFGVRITQLMTPEERLRSIADER